MSITLRSDVMAKHPARASDPLLQPFRLKGLTLRNRLAEHDVRITIDHHALASRRRVSGQAIAHRDP